MGPLHPCHLSSVWINVAYETHITSAMISAKGTMICFRQLALHELKDSQTIRRWTYRRVIETTAFASPHSAQCLLLFHFFFFFLFHRFLRSGAAR